MLKNTASSIAPSLTDLFDLSLRLGKVPSSWKESLITPIPKVSQPKSPNDFHPISLLSIPSKLLEKNTFST